MNHFVAPRFRRIVALHVLKNLLNISSVDTPLILGIHGPPGQGKTYQCEKVLQEMHVRSRLISGGQLESEDAGRPAQLLRETYREAGEEMKRGETYGSVVLINDFDTGVGDWGKIVQLTINTQQLFAELMHLCDYPEDVEGKSVMRVPIIVTGNNFLGLHAPLIRTGRMWRFEWVPNPDERRMILQGIFPDVAPDDVERLDLEFPNEPVAFFSFMRSSTLDDQLWNYVESVGLDIALGKLRHGERITGIRMQYTIEDLLSTGRQIQRDGRLQNHI